MITSARFAALCWLASASLTFAADSTPAAAPVVERAPDPASDAEALRAENQRLAQELQAAAEARRHAEADLAALTTAKAQDEAALNESARELATLRAKVARLEAAPAATPAPAAGKNQQLEIDLARRTAELRDAQTVANAAQQKETAEKARADEAQARLTTLTAGIDRLLAENATLEAQLRQVRDAEASVRTQLAAAQSAGSQPAPDLSAKLADTEAKLAEAGKSLAGLRAENTLLKRASEDQARLAGELEKLRQEKAAAAAPAPAETAPASPELTAKVAELEEKLSTALRSYSLLQTENEQLKAAGTERSAAADELATLRRQNADLEARLAAVPPPAPDLSAKLAETEDKLTTVLRSYSLLQNEVDQIKADASHAAEQAGASASKAAGESAAQVSALFNELRQTQAQAATLAAENSQLKFRLAATGPVPGSTLATPQRPGAAPTAAVQPPTPAPAAPEAAAPAAGPRTHVVVAGDSLTRLARTYYGNANRWDEILNANRDVIRNENVLPLGVTLRIP